VENGDWNDQVTDGRSRR